MRVYGLTNLDMDFNDKYYKFSFRPDTKFDEMNAALAEFKVRIEELRVKQEAELAKQVAEKESALDGVEKEIEALGSTPVA